MEKVSDAIKALAIVSMVAAMATILSCSNNSSSGSISQAELDSLRNQISELTKGNEMIAKNLATFDTLDYTVFSNQEWTRLHESHSKDIKVNWPNGHSTTGIERHIADLKTLFVHAPDTKIKQHLISFGSGNMTCVTGIMTGTFTLPIHVVNGSVIEPTGKAFSIPMCTVGIWANGVMVEEYRFWDNQAYMNQIGLSPNYYLR